MVINCYRSRYIVGVAIRLAVDLGLHCEDSKETDRDLDDPSSQANQSHRRERGRREYTRDLRRRLWWCTYSLDRLVSVCVGRPVGISDLAVTTEFPSLLGDRYITQTGFQDPPPDGGEPTYKLVAHHYFRLRLLQSEILEVLQYQQAQVSRAGGQNQKNTYMHTHLRSPFLSGYDSFRSWRKDIDRRLYEWKESAPRKGDIGVDFSVEFFNLNYWQTIIMLYRQSLSVPAMFEGEYHTSKEVNSPSVHNIELREDEDRVYLKVAEAGQKTLRLYRQLHIVSLVNYTYLATHHLFTAGISYLYAIWHSPIVRSRLVSKPIGPNRTYMLTTLPQSMDEVDFTMLAATSVFSDLIEKCPPAEACRDAFERTAKATVKMVNSIGGFGQPTTSAHSRKRPISGGGSLDYRYESSLAANAPSKYHRRLSHEHQPQRNQFHMATDESPTQPANHHSPPTQHVKSETDSFSMAPPFSGQPRSNAGSSVAPITPEASGSDRRLLSSPTTTRLVTPGGLHPGSPLSGGLPTQLPPMQGTSTNSSNTPMAVTPTATAAPSYFPLQQQTGGFVPGTIDLSELQGMDFLQNLGDTGISGPAGGDIGLGWEGGYHHDFSDGQQIDLFDGFFFGEPRGNGNGINGVGGIDTGDDDS